MGSVCPMQYGVMPMVCQTCDRCRDACDPKTCAACIESDCRLWDEDAADCGLKNK